MYQVGQAVILENNSLLFAKLGGFENILGQDCVMSDSAYHYSRPATEAEILAEAVKHGWVEKINIESPFDYFELSKKDKWEWISFPPTLQENLKEYCEDGLIAHRLITALNLAK